MREAHHSEELEIQVLGDLMAIGNSQSLMVQKAMLQLNPKSFYKPLNAELFALIMKSFHKGQPFGFMDTFANIAADKVALYDHQVSVMSSHTGMQPGVESFEYHVQRLISLERVRNNIAVLESSLAEAYSMTDPNEINSLLRVRSEQICQIDSGECSEAVMEEEIIAELQSGKSDEATLMPTSSDRLNSFLGGGPQSGSLITIAGAAGVGKTGFAIWLMDSIATQQPGKQAIFFSLEMRPSEIVKRHLGIKVGNVYARHSHEERAKAIEKAKKFPLALYDYRNPDLDFILTNSRLDAAKTPVSVIVVDYLTLVTIQGSFERNDLRQTQITSKLAWLASNLDCIVIALSQVNRGAANREDQCPMPHDAADSSGSHKSSHIWLGIDRPEIYLDDPCYRDQFVIKCRKNRTGDNFEHIMSFNSGTFVEVNPGYFRKPEKKVKGERLFEEAYKPYRA